MATHSSAFAWKILWTEEPGRLQFIGSQRVGHDLISFAHTHKDVVATNNKAQWQKTLQ